MKWMDDRIAIEPQLQIKFRDFNTQREIENQMTDMGRYDVNDLFMIIIRWLQQRIIVIVLSSKWCVINDDFCRDGSVGAIAVVTKDSYARRRLLSWQRYAAVSNDSFICVDGFVLYGKHDHTETIVESQRRKENY